MRSWMSIAAATAARAEPNSASMESPVLWTSEPPALSMAGRQTSLRTDCEMPESEVLLAFGQADEAGEVGVKDRGKAAARDVHGGSASKGRKAAQFKSEARQTLYSARRRAGRR